jgi:hypothetical protein
VRGERAVKRWAGARELGARVAAEAVEACGGRKRVDAGGEARFRVFSEVREDVDESVSHLPWGREVAAVPAVGPETATTQDELVDVAGDADGDASDPRGEGALVARLYDEVHVIPLDGEVEDAKVGGSVGGTADGEAHGGKHVLAAQWAEE